MMQRPISLACRSAAALSLLLPALAIAAPDLGATLPALLVAGVLQLALGRIGAKG